MSRITSSSFWTSCTLVLISTVSTWWWSTAQANRNRKANESEILAAIRNNNAIFEQSFGGSPPGATVHPSLNSNEILRDRLDLASREVMLNWTNRRAAQEKYLRWPAVVNADGELAQAIASFEPTQEFSVRAQHRGRNAPELPNLMLIYGQQIPKHFLEITYRYHLNSSSSISVLPKDIGLSPKPTWSSIDWKQTNCDLWRKKLSGFSRIDGNLSPANVPLPRQAFALQEDVWLFEAFLEIVKLQNRNALSHSQRVVTGIDHVFFGREAWVERDSSLSQPDSRLFAQHSQGHLKEKKEDIREDFEDPRPAHKPGNRFTFEIEGPNAALAPFHGRYVGPDFRPLTIQDWSTILDLQDLPDTNVEGVVCRRVPFRIALRISEQALPELMHAMQGDELAFEIRQLRINRESEYSGPGYSPISRNSDSNKQNNRPQVEGPGSQVDGESSTGTASRFAGKIGTVNRQNAEVRRNDIVNVEFSGTVRLVNPVNTKLIHFATRQTRNELSWVKNARELANN
ncbi:MAG: hypothetical protein ABL888_03990 [Pirellulaceae bacterium]